VYAQFRLRRGRRSNGRKQMESGGSGGYGSGILGGICGVLLALLAIGIGYTVERTIGGGAEPAVHGGTAH
jgi:hypothetical protein